MASLTPELSGQILAERLTFGLSKLSESVEMQNEIRGGVPVLKGSRLPVARILAELGDDATITEIADDYDLDVKQLKDFIEGLAILLDRPVVNDNIPA